mmetsp:Transcript_42401/g.98202  ORF Transcript_42401/g.98202 Transcript_42401/m.98202 type:complete len:202 (+) Transcript_42401:158-763(+)
MFMWQEERGGVASKARPRVCTQAPLSPNHRLAVHRKVVRSLALAARCTLSRPDTGSNALTVEAVLALHERDHRGLSLAERVPAEATHRLLGRWIAWAPAGRWTSAQILANEQDAGGKEVPRQASLQAALPRLLEALKLCPDCVCECGLNQVPLTRADRQALKQLADVVPPRVRCGEVGDAAVLQQLLPQLEHTKDKVDVLA